VTKTFLNSGGFKMLKGKSESWQLALRLARRKDCLWYPVKLYPCGAVMARGYIFGNTWRYTLDELKTLAKAKGLKC